MFDADVLEQAPSFTEQDRDGVDLDGSVIVMGLTRVVEVDHLGGHTLRVTFSDGLVRELDFSSTLRRGVFAPLEDEAVFAKAGVDAVAGTVSWPTVVDLDPDVLHGDHAPASATPPRLVREYKLHPTG